MGEWLPSLSGGRRPFQAAIHQPNTIPPLRATQQLSSQPAPGSSSKPPSEPNPPPFIPRPVITTAAAFGLQISTTASPPSLNCHPLVKSFSNPSHTHRHHGRDPPEACHCWRRCLRQNLLVDVSEAVLFCYPARLTSHLHPTIHPSIYLHHSRSISRIHLACRIQFANIFSSVFSKGTFPEVSSAELSLFRPRTCDRLLSPSAPPVSPVPRHNVNTTPI